MGGTRVKQLEELATTLDHAGIEWWVTCGTLLSLIREGGLFPDDAIDIEVWAPSWEAVDRELRAAGYRVRPHPYRGMIYKLWATHPERDRSVDVHVLRQTDGVVWYPVKANLGAERGPIGFARRAFRRLWRSTSLLDTSRAAERVLGWLRFRIHSVQVPASLYGTHERRRLGGIDLPVPSPPESVLEFHYGDWQTPVRVWDMSTDDPSYIWGPPPGHDGN